RNEAAIDGRDSRPRDQAPYFRGRIPSAADRARGQSPALEASPDAERGFGLSPARGAGGRRARYTACAGCRNLASCRLRAPEEERPCRSRPPTESAFIIILRVARGRRPWCCCTKWAERSTAGTPSFRN